MLGCPVRLKKAQSERRLEHTATNMEKARALLAEIEPHLKFLRRQKSRFERRSEVETELRRLENSFFAIRYQKESEILKVDFYGLLILVQNINEPSHKYRVSQKSIQIWSTLAMRI